MRGRKIKPSRKEEGPRSTIAKHAVFFEATTATTATRAKITELGPARRRANPKRVTVVTITVASAVRAPRKIKTHANRRVGWGEEGGDLNDFIVETTFWVELAAAV